MLQTPTLSKKRAEDMHVALKNWVQIVRKYQKPSTRKAMVQLANTFLPFIGIWVLMYFSLDYSYWLTMGLGIINAFFLVRIFIIQHDCGHQSFIKSRSWNNVLGFICSIFSLIPYKYWARSHSQHHSHNGQLENRDMGDITLLTVNEYMALSPFKRFTYRIYRHPISMFIIGSVYYVVVHNRLPLLNFKRWDKYKISLIWSNLATVAVYVLLCWALGWKEFFMVQIPIICMFSLTALWFFYVQHQHEHAYKQWVEHWDYLTAAIKGSTYYKLPKIMTWLTGNIGYHHIHHLSSLIPNYNLARCNKENPAFEKYTTILTFRDSLKCMFNKLWDEESGRMITFKEFNRIEESFKARFGKDYVKVDESKPKFW